MNAMKLYEIVTTRVGESYVRAYAWAPNRDAALLMFKERNPSYDVKEVRQLIHRDASPFCTKASDEGWEAV